MLFPTLLRQTHLVLTLAKLMTTLFAGAVDTVRTTDAMLEVRTGQLFFRKWMTAGIALFVLTLL
jgi:hypothetical protein